ncbi:MAG: hypothetical protein ACMXYB_05360 [Candidatus Woesearchaeota archaeon]
MNKQVQGEDNEYTLTKKSTSNSSNSTTINTTQLVFEIIILIGYLIALVPFGYLFSLWFVIPLTLSNFILSLISNNNTQVFTGVNFIMSLLSLIPLIGYIFRIVGIIMTVLSISKLQEVTK